VQGRVFLRLVATRQALRSRDDAVSDTLTYTRGKHTLKGGIDVRRVRYFDLESFAPEFASDDFGDFSFQGGYTGNGFGDLLMGNPTTEYFAYRARM